MKVIHVTYDASPYGIGSFLLHLVSYQGSHYKDTQFAIAFHAWHENIAKFEEIGVPIYCLKEKTARNIRLFFKFLTIFKEYDIANFHTFSPWAFLAAWALKKKTIFTFHGSFGFKKIWRDLPLSYFYRLGINTRCSKITFATETSKSIYFKRINCKLKKEKISLFPYGLQINRIKAEKST